MKVVQSGPHAGRVYVLWLAGDIATNVATGCNVTQLNTFHTIWTAWSDDGGQTWTPHLVYDAGPGHDGSALFADLTLDNVGNPYAAFGMNLDPSGTTDMFVEASLDAGETWNGKTDGSGVPYRVNVASGPDATKTNVFPAIAAGDPGKIDVAYIGTATDVPELPYGKVQPGGDPNALWYTYVAQSLDLASRQPTFTVTKVTTDPIHKGDVCVLGIFCQSQLGSDRSLLDFIDIAIDNDGYSHTSYTANLGSSNGIYVANQVGGDPVVKVPTTLTYSGAMTAATGTTATYTATLTTGSGAPVAGKTVTFKLGSQSAVTGTTNAAGVATAQQVVSLTPGSYTLASSFAGDSGHGAANASTPFTVTPPPKQDTSLALSIGKKTISATLTSGGSGVAGETIQFFVNGTSVGSAQTDASGTATIARPKSLRKGDTVKAVFAGDGTHNGSQAQATVTK